MSVKLKEFFFGIFRGFAIGIAFIIPGFSGGTVAVILGIYDKMIAAVTGIFKQFRSSILFLLPIAIGMGLAFAALFFPIKIALTYAAFPTLCLFVGLMLGGMVPVVNKAAGKGNGLFGRIIAGVICCAVAVGVGFLPEGFTAPTLGNSMNVVDYLLLFAVGALAACALVVPGISGSMLLLAFGYYTPIMYDVIGNFIAAPGINILILVVLIVGMAAGFFFISFLMRYLMYKFPRGTYYAIIGFVLGSIVTIFYAGAVGRFTVEGDLPMVFDFSPWQIALAAFLALIGFAAAFIFTFVTARKYRKAEKLQVCEQSCDTSITSKNANE